MNLLIIVALVYVVHRLGWRTDWRSIGRSRGVTFVRLLVGADLKYLGTWIRWRYLRRKASW